MSVYSSSGTKQMRFVIKENESLSNFIDISGFKYIGLIIPEDWTSADITFCVAVDSDDESFVPLYDDGGNEVIIETTSEIAISLDSTFLKLAPWRFIKIRSGTFESPIVQTEKDKIIDVQLKR